MAGWDDRQVRLQALRWQIAKAQSFSTRSDEQVPLGIAQIDACLNGGLACGALHEIAAADHRSIPAALGFLLALTHMILVPPPFTGEGDHAKRGGGGGSFRPPRRFAPLPPQAGGEPLLSPPPQVGEDNPLHTHSRSPANILWPFAKTAPAFGIPYAPGLKFFGLDPSRIVFVRCASARDCLWAMEEGLHLGGIAAVIGARGKAMDLTASRRLQLAAEQAATPVFLLRGYNDHAASAAVTRWRVAAAPSARDEFGFTKNTRFRVALEYARGGKTGEWVMEWNSDALRLRLSSALGDRAAGRAA